MRLAEDATAHLPPIFPVPSFEHCEGHLLLVSLHLTQQLHPIINPHTTIILFALIITSGTAYVTRFAAVENAMFTLSTGPFLLSDSVSHSDANGFLSVVDVGAEGQHSFPSHHIKEHHPPWPIRTRFRDGVVVDGEALCRESFHHIFFRPFHYSLYTCFFFLQLFCHFPTFLLIFYQLLLNYLYLFLASFLGFFC